VASAFSAPAEPLDDVDVTLNGCSDLAETSSRVD
jgi:hypothetical protein